MEQVTLVLADTVIIAQREETGKWGCQFTHLFDKKQAFKRLTDAEFAAVVAMVIGGEDFEDSWAHNLREIAEMAVNELDVRVLC